MTFGDVFECVCVNICVCRERGVAAAVRGETGGNDVASVAVTKDGRGRRGGYDKAMV